MDAENEKNADCSSSCLIYVFDAGWIVEDGGSRVHRQLERDAQSLLDTGEPADEGRIGRFLQILCGVPGRLDGVLRGDPNWRGGHEAGIPAPLLGPGRVGVRVLPKHRSSGIYSDFWFGKRVHVLTCRT